MLMKHSMANGPAGYEVCVEQLHLFSILQRGKMRFFRHREQDLLKSVLPWPRTVTALRVPCAQPLALPGRYMVIWLKERVKITIF